MSDVISDPLKKKTTRPRKPRMLTEIEEFTAWLATLGLQSTPKIHINGPMHTGAVLVVDFGTPLHETVKLNPDQSAELISHMRASTKALFKDRDVTARVQNDSNAGIWWSAVA
jgi:hypothetical protein